MRVLAVINQKGGVGKTTTAGALGLMAADAGRSTLLVSTDPAHSLGDAFDMQIGNRETSLSLNLTGLEIDPDAEAERHIATELYPTGSRFVIYAPENPRIGTGPASQFVL